MNSWKLVDHPAQKSFSWCSSRKASPSRPKQPNLNLCLLVLQVETEFTSARTPPKDLKDVANQIDQLEAESGQTELCEELECAANCDGRRAFRERGDQSVLGEEQATESSDFAIRSLPAAADLGAVDHPSWDRTRPQLWPVRVRHLAAAGEQQLGEPVDQPAGDLPEHVPGGQVPDRRLVLLPSVQRSSPLVLGPGQRLSAEAALRVRLRCARAERRPDRHHNVQFVNLVDLGFEKLGVCKLIKLEPPCE